MIALLCLPLLAAAPAAADVLAPGTRPVRHELVLEHSPHFSEHDFVAAPVRGFGGCTRIVPGVPFTFSSKYGTRIFAIEPGADCPEEHEGPEGPAVQRIARASGEIPVTEVSSVPVTSTVQGLTTRLVIAKISDGVIRLEVVERETARNRSLVAWLALTFGIGLVGMAWMARRTRRGGG
jgi:hypothetical protein